MKKTRRNADETVINKIYLIRGKRIMIDRDLAEMYGVETRILNQAVKRNAARFPADFMFQLKARELNDWKSQIVTSREKKMGLRKLPLAFTEQGVAMLSGVLNSKTAIEVNIRIIRVFTRMREMLLTHKDILLKVEKMEHQISKHDHKLGKHKKEMHIIFTALKELLNPPAKPMRKIGFRFSKENSSSLKLLINKPRKRSHRQILSLP